MIRTLALAAVLATLAQATVAASAPGAIAAVVPLPQPRPDVMITPTSADNSPDDRDSAGPVRAPEREDPAAHSACLAALKQAGLVFHEAPGFDDGDGCGIDQPVVLEEALPGVPLEPKATLRCATALALTHWVGQTVVPSAALAFGGDEKLVRLHQATSYMCRNRNGVATAKLSEHARGNGIDIDAFTFSDGRRIAVEPRVKDGSLTAAFQRAVIASACLHFTTVLGPDSDAAHRDHIHLDVLERRGGYRYCW